MQQRIRTACQLIALLGVTVAVCTPPSLRAQERTPAGSWQGDCFGFVLDAQVGVATRSCDATVYKAGDTIVRVIHRAGTSFVGEMLRLDKRAFIPVAGSVRGADSLRLFFAEGSLFVRRPRESGPQSLAAWPGDVDNRSEDITGPASFTIRMKRGALLRVMDAALGGPAMSASLTVTPDANRLDVVIRERLPVADASAPPVFTHLIVRLGNDSLDLPTFSPSRELSATSSALVTATDTYSIPLTDTQLALLLSQAELSARFRGLQFTMTSPDSGVRRALVAASTQATPAVVTSAIPAAPDGRTNTRGASQSAPDSSHAGAPLTFRRGPSGWTSVTDARITAAVTAWNRAFRTWRPAELDPDNRPCLRASCDMPTAVPWAVASDFNGDGITDVFLRGHDAKRTFSIAVMSIARGYRVDVVEEATYQSTAREQYYMRIEPKGTLSTCMEGDVLLPTDAVYILNSNDKGSYLQSFRQNTWHVVSTMC